MCRGNWGSTSRTRINFEYDQLFCPLFSISLVNERLKHLILFAKWPVFECFAALGSQKDRIEENVPGRFYVDDECVSCEICQSLASEFFDAPGEGFICPKTIGSAGEDRALFGNHG
jgi:hypothetical protein